MTNEARLNSWGEVGKQWVWLLVLGVIFVVLGSIGILMVPIMTLSAVTMFGVFMIIGGILQLYHSIKKSEGWTSKVVQILISLIYLFGGIVTIANPVLASTVLTLFLAGSLVGIGILRIVTAFQNKETLKSWIWIVISGILSIIIGFMIGLHWPVSSIWALGLFISIDLIFSGWTYIFFALAAKKYA